MENIISNKKAKIYLAIAISIVGVSNIFDIYVLELASVGFYAGVKYAVAAFVFLVMFPPKKKDLFGPHMKELTLKSVTYLVHLSLFFAGITMVTGITATMLFALGPILLFAASVEVLHEKLNLRIFLGLLVAVSGVMLMIVTTSNDTNGTNSWVGITLILAAVVVQVVSTLLSKRLLKERVPPDTLAGVGLFWSAVYFLVVAAWQSGAESTPDITAQVWALTIFSGLVFTLIPWALYYRALKKIELEQVSVFVYLGPVTGAIAAVVILGEQVTLPILVGSGLVLLGLWLSQHKATSFNPHFHALHHIEIGKNIKKISTKIVNSIE